MSNTHGLTKGSILIIRIEGNPLDGMKAKYVRQSPKTGKCTVELLETRGAYQKGEYVTVDQSEMC